MNLLKEYSAMIVPVVDMEVLEIQRSSHTFKVHIDFASLQRRIRSDSAHVRLGTVREVPHEEYLAEVAKMRSDIMVIREDTDMLTRLIDGAPRKKDGTFVNGRILMRIDYPKTGRLNKYYGVNKWNYVGMRAVTTDDTYIVIDFAEYSK